MVSGGAWLWIRDLSIDTRWSIKMKTQMKRGKEMFKPIFHYTDKIVRDLTQIAAAREFVVNSPFIPQW